MATTDEKRTAFRRLHETGCFVIPNPWTVGTVRWLEHLGFPALATTSAGAAFALGLPDYGIGRDAMLAHVRAIVEAADVPVSADFQSGYGDDPAGVAESVARCAVTGVAGLSVEDSTGDVRRPLYDLGQAVERVRAARAAAPEVVLTARAEGFLVGVRDLDDVVRRLRAYGDAGADCLYAPALATREEIATAVAAVAPKPVNVLAGGAMKMAVADLAALGVRRISVGSALARAAWAGFVRGARALAEGRFDGLADAVPVAELNAFFGADRRR